MGLIYLCVKLLPPYINNYQFEQGIQDIARFSSYAQNKMPEDIRKEVLEKARECDVMLTPEQVRVEKSGTTVNIDVAYTVHVDLPGKPVDLKFNPVAGNKIITAR